MTLKLAEISDGKLLIEGQEVDDVTLLSQGQRNSKGVVVMDRDETIYLSNTQPDLQVAIDKIVSVCEQLSILCKAELMLGGTGSAPLKPFQAQGTEIEALKQELEELKLL
jgi:hypothetical protein